MRCGAPAVPPTCWPSSNTRRKPFGALVTIVPRRARLRSMAAVHSREVSGFTEFYDESTDRVRFHSLPYASIQPGSDA